MKKIVCDMCDLPISIHPDFESKSGCRYEISVTKHWFFGLNTTFSRGQLDLHDDCREALLVTAGVSLPD